MFFLVLLLAVVAAWRTYQAKRRFLPTCLASVSFAVLAVFAWPRILASRIEFDC